MRKYLLFLMFTLFTGVTAFAQVTTSTVVGTIKDEKGATLPGATIVLTHVPTGTIYTTVSRPTGQYTIPNARVGGPYTIKVTFIGFEPQVVNNLNLTLGTPLKLDITLPETGKQLAEVTVKGTKKGAVISSERNGASTNVSLTALQQLPTLTRSVQDFTRLTPQAISSTSNTDGSPMGISFAGQSNRYNQFTIDGANNSDAFGLSASGTNGAQAGINPIPLESIQEVQVLLSPYDVTQGGFTGGGINAVTKGGTNTIHGSAYYTLQNQDLVGKSVINDQKYATFKNKTFGASLGGPIIKNKLFYFVNYERFDNTTPLAFDPTVAGSGSKFDVATLQDLRDFVKSKYSYDPGDFGSINKSIYSNSVFGRLDWNINDKNKLTYRHSYVKGSNYVISRSPTSITFSDGGYYFNSTTNSDVLELNSSISSTSSNVLRLTYSAIRDGRTTSPFPNVQISQAGTSGLVYNFGSEFSSSANSLNQDLFTIVDNYTIYKNNHTITVGTDNEFYNTKNVFMQAYNGAYTYNTSGADNIAAFKANTAAPNSYTLNYDVNNPGNKYGAVMHTAQLSVYGQDVWAIKDNFKLTYGLRVDVPVYFNRPTENVAFNSDPFFNGIQNNKTPKSTPLFSPRVGFNWDINGDASTQLRGGAGIFTGRVPFVWISNQYGGTGVTTIRYAPSGTSVPANLRFNYNPNALLGGAYVPSGNTPPATEVDVTDPNFKVPQTLRGNLAVDRKLGFWGLVGTLEGIYTKVLNNVNYQQLNLGPQAGVVTIGSSTRPWYNFVRPDSKFTDVLELTNTSKGYAYNVTAQIQKPMSADGWAGSLAYTYGESYSLNDGLSSVATSNWRAMNVNGLNSLDVARSNYDPGSRIIFNVFKTFKYAHNRLATTVGLVYIGQSGQPYSLVYNRNINGDDVTNRTSTSSFYGLAYLPSQAELADPNGWQNYKLVDITGSSPRTAAQQWADLAAYINNNPALAKNAGKVVPRNGLRLPWENHVDVKISEDIMLKGSHKLQISFDVLNAGNLINKKWGRSYGLTNQNASPITAFSTTTNTPTFQFDQTKLNNVDGVQREYFINDLLSRWRGQISAKYSF